MTDIIHSLAALRARVADWRENGDSVALIPTMGALHDGHLTLAGEGQKKADRTIVTIFVNPTQFGEGEDFDAYPRTEKEDVEKLDRLGIDVAFCPKAEDVYAGDAATTVSVDALNTELCGAARPGHFDGVTTIVMKLLMMVLPDVAVFGEKDYQQLCIIKRMVRDLNVPVKIAACPTMREPDGVAMSSRNAYLTPNQRSIAPTLQQTLKKIATEAKKAGNFETLCASGIDALLDAGFRAVDYLEIRDAETLQPATDLSRPARILAAAHLGKTRLIDNIPLG